MLIIYKGIFVLVMIKSITNFLIIFFIFQQLKSQISQIDQHGYNAFCDETLHISSKVTDNFCVKDKPKINKPPKYSIAGKGFKFAHLNVVSLVKNFEEIKLFLDNNEVDLLALNETRLDGTIFDSEISIPNL